MTVDDKRIREFAYQIWESEGKPDGQENRHWDMARKLAEAESLAPKAKPRKPSAANGSSAAASTKPTSVSKAAPEKKPRAPRKPAAT
ncbi:hypothetical protein DCO48_20060 [Pseudomonas sp. SDI]|uniref:DUF2934 domain-containing protein n=1 Tax=Pseudomonas sp. SDI TaxID=2170734 RepID=UPI000DE6051B|nr:DUF2934 domain-containing protein [Pseudomonas sp. SDI]PWB30541.1 hypothetical protein DCO48_20060 [Pseudomonas sp. SDI]